MKQKTMVLIILIMALSMIGIGVIQFIWFYSSVEQDRKNFDDKVKIALGIVKEHMMNDAQKENIVLKKLDDYRRDKKRSSFLEYNQYKTLLKGKSRDFILKDFNLDINGAEMLINPNSFLERLPKDKLHKYLKHEMRQQEIDLEFDYGVYSNKEESFIIMNGNYTASIGNTNQSSQVQTGNDLYNSDYKISLFDSPFSTEEDGSVLESAPGFLQVHFPKQSQALWSTVIPSLVMSILFTGLVLFCFGYVMYVIRRQKLVSEMKTDFINNMTHEFKTPIATISLATDSIESPMILNDESKVKRFTNIIKQENKRMLGQVEKVLQMAMLDKKDFQLKLSNLNMHDVIENAAEKSRLKVAAKNGTVITDLKALDHIVSGDQTHISNIIFNLLDNAEKYSKDNVKIKIKTENKNGALVVHVSDNGIGMTKEQVKNIFEKFYRAHTGNIHDVKGFGLGLSYVKAIVDAHKGSIDVQSELGKGSTFSLNLPLEQ